ncbi:MAG: hypothetical protein ACKOOC_01930 [Cyanobium sp.]
MQAPDHVLPLRFAPDGGVEAFDAPARHALPRTLWRLAPTMRSETTPVRRQWLEDMPFYVRAVLDARVGGEPVVAMHETLDVGRLAMRAVQSMLTFRMPRRVASFARRDPRLSGRIGAHAVLHTHNRKLGYHPMPI